MATVELTRENFESVVADHALVIVDFWAPWCGPCKQLTPLLERAVTDAKGKPMSDAAIAEAARLVLGGQPVAVPTETVYGLAADATNPSAVARIYAAKGRPAFNPLIVHVPDLAMIAVHTSDGSGLNATVMNDDVFPAAALDTGSLDGSRHARNQDGPGFWQGR